MKEFHEFEKYLAAHEQEVLYDTLAAFGSDWNQNLTLSQEDITLVTKISRQMCLALLRAYFHWSEENP